jgi:hypothetical protein
MTMSKIQKNANRGDALRIEAGTWNALLGIARNSQPGAGASGKGFRFANLKSESMHPWEIFEIDHENDTVKINGGRFTRWEQVPTYINTDKVDPSGALFVDFEELTLPMAALRIGYQPVTFGLTGSDLVAYSALTVSAAGFLIKEANDQPPVHPTDGNFYIDYQIAEITKADGVISVNQRLRADIFDVFGGTIRYFAPD